MSTPKSPRKSALPLVDTLELTGRRVFVRLDLDAPVDHGKVTDDTRLRAALPTLKHCLERGARLVLGGHRGRPKGAEPSASVAAAGDVLAGLLRTEILLAEDPVGDGPSKLARDLRDGQVLMLENLRFHEGEDRNDDLLARQWATLADVYVNEDFASAHRATASNVGLPGLIKARAAGLHLANEVDALGRVLAAPRADFVAVVGGTRFADIISLFERLLPRVETLLVAGSPAITFLAAQGRRLGASTVDTGHLRTAAELLAAAQKRGVEVLLPIDHLATERPEPSSPAVLVPEQDVPEGLYALDIGPRSQSRFVERLAVAKTILWHGVAGHTRLPRFAGGTQALARAAGAANGLTVAVGDDTVAAVHAAGAAAKFTHLSTGGAAALEFLEGRELPGLTALGWKRGL